MRAGVGREGARRQQFGCENEKRSLRDFNGGFRHKLCLTLRGTGGGLERTEEKKDNRRKRGLKRNYVRIVRVGTKD